MTDFVSLPALFQSIYIPMGNGGYESMEEEQVWALIDKIDACQNLVTKEALFSKNETLEDVHTETMKYLYLPYFRAKCLMSIRDMDKRRSNLLQAKDFLDDFLHSCSLYGVLHESEMKKVENAVMSAEEKRNSKIEKYKRDKAAKLRMQELTRFLAITKEDGEVDNEDQQRELYLLTLQSYARDAIDDLELLREELMMLAMRAQEHAVLEERSEKNERRGEPANQQSLVPPGSKALDPNRPGIEITKTYKVGDQIIMSRDTVKAQVFGDRIAPPTMSLEEFADLEMQQALEREQRQQEGDGATKRYQQLLQEGLEDDADLVDAATVKDREWDDWKDNNPRGWGNKMGKRF
eukprot:gene30560-36933_t